MRFLITFLLAGMTAWIPFDAAAQNKILATVNDEAVSQMDLQQRKTLIRLLSKDRKIPNDKQILDQLIDEKLKLQEAQKQNVSLSSAEAEKIVSEAVRQNGYSLNELKALLKKNNLPFEVVENMIKADVMFLRAARKHAGERAEVSDGEVAAKLKEAEETLATKQYLLSEIVIPVNGEKEDAAAYGRAMQALIDLKDGISLEKVVAEYSTALSASKGGMLGWIAESKLPPEIREELELMSVGEASTPVKTAGVYKVLILHNIQNPTDLNNNEAYKLSQIFVPKNAKNKQKLLKDIKKTNGSCEKFVTLAIQQNQTPRIDLGTLTTGEIPPPVLERIQKAGILQITEPLTIESGDLYFMACEKTTASVLPTKEQLRMQLENARIDVIAQRRLRDLRRTSVMDIRQ